MITQQEFVPIAGVDNCYFVNNQGVVISRKFGVEKILGGHVAPFPGYRIVSLMNNGQRKPRYVHHLVAEAFIGPKPCKWAEINHKDLDKRNNNVDNLEWVTQKENNEHARKNGALSIEKRKEQFRLKLEQAEGIIQRKKQRFEAMKTLADDIIALRKDKKTFREMVEITGSTIGQIQRALETFYPEQINRHSGITSFPSTAEFKPSLELKHLVEEKLNRIDRVAEQIRYNKEFAEAEKTRIAEKKENKKKMIQAVKGMLQEKPKDIAAKLGIDVKDVYYYIQTIKKENI